MFYDHELDVYTIAMSRWRDLKDTDIELLDVTLKTKDNLLYKLFAPPCFNLVMDYKRGKITKCEFEEAYLNKLINSSNKYHNEWVEFLNSKDKIALACFCGDVEGCHRKILKDYIIDFGLANDIIVNDKGEYRKGEVSE